MTKFATLFTAVAIMLSAPLHAHAVTAMASDQTYVSGANGASDSNPCTRASPCATFEGAYAKTAPGGEIDVLDGGDFGMIVISQAITIANDGAGTAAITPDASTEAVVIQAGATDAVVLRGLTLNGVSTTGSVAGVLFLSGGSLIIDHCTIQGFQASGDAGIQFLPGNANSKLSVKDTVLSNDGATSGAALFIQPHLGFTATADLERVQILDAIGNGVRADATKSSPVDVELRDVIVDSASGGAGIVAVSPTSGGPSARILAEHVTSSHNPGYGFKASGGTASIYLRHSAIENNGVGLGASNGGQIFSYGDNAFTTNTSGNGVTPTGIPPE